MIESVDQQYTVSDEWGDLKGARFDACTFHGVNWSEKDLRGARFENCTWVDCDLSNIRTLGLGLQIVRFEACKLVGVNFSLCNELGLNIHFEGCILDAANFEGCQRLLDEFDQRHPLGSLPYDKPEDMRLYKETTTDARARRSSWRRARSRNG